MLKKKIKEDVQFQWKSHTVNSELLEGIRKMQRVNILVNMK